MQKLWKAQTLVTSFAILSALLLLSMSASFNAKHLRLGVEASRAPNALIELEVKVDIRDVPRPKIPRTGKTKNVYLR